MPQDPWGSSYRTGAAEPAPHRYLPHHRPPFPDLRRPPRLLGLILAVLFAGGVTTAVLLLAHPGSDPAPVVAPVVPEHAGERPVPIGAHGTATLSDPTISTAKVPYEISSQWCSLLTAADVVAETGFNQLGAPDGTLLCTHYFTDNDGYLFVSDIPATEGVPSLVRGNTAIVYQSDPGSCEVSVALNPGGGVLDIDVRGVASPRVPLCQAVVNLAGRAFDRLPDA